MTERNWIASVIFLKKKNLFTEIFIRLFEHFLWDNLCNWLSRGKNSVIQLSSFDICFSYNITTPNFLLNQLILIGKVFIFQCKTAEYMSSINNYKILIKDTEKIEWHIALQNNIIDRHIKKWKSVIPNINWILFVFLKILHHCVKIIKLAK